MVTAEVVAENLSAVKRRIEQAGGDPVKAAGLEAKLNEDIENDPGELTV